jgi:hypothetical protein
MEFLLTCLYCGNEWERVMYSGFSEVGNCPKCNDKNIDVKDLSKAKIDQYRDCAPFPEKESEVPDLLKWFGGD